MERQQDSDGADGGGDGARRGCRLGLCGRTAAVWQETLSHLGAGGTAGAGCRLTRDE